MNRTLALTGVVSSPPLQRTQFFIALNAHGSTHAAGSWWGISGDLTNFSSTNGALRVSRAVKGADEG